MPFWRKRTATARWILEGRNFACVLCPCTCRVPPSYHISISRISRPICLFKSMEYGLKHRANFATPLPSHLFCLVGLRTTENLFQLVLGLVGGAAMCGLDTSPFCISFTLPLPSLHPLTAVEFCTACCHTQRQGLDICV